MIIVLDYLLDTGAIVSKFVTPYAEWASEILPGEGRIVLHEDVDAFECYVLEGELAIKSKILSVTSNETIIANGTDEAIISNIPAGVQVEWPDGQIDIVNDGEIRFSVDLPGTYTFRFTAVPYLDQEVVIEAIPAT